MDVRRVVTGHDDSGKAVFVSDERVAPAAPKVLAGSEFHELWGGDATLVVFMCGAHHDRVT